MSIKRIGLFLLFFVSILTAFSQSNKKKAEISISGKVVNIKTNEYVPFAAIGITRNRMGALADTLGVFHLRIQQSDTLVVNAMGYEPKVFVVPYILDSSNPPFFTIEIKDKSYMIKEVKIYAFGTYEKFKYDFIKLKLEDVNPINKSIYTALNPYMKRAGKNPVPAYARTKRERYGILGAIFAPTDFLYSKLSKKERQKKKATQYIRNANKRKIIAKKYNARLVGEVTGLRGRDLVEFMEFSGPRMKKIKVSTSSYDITKQIMRLYELYKLNSRIR